MGSPATPPTNSTIEDRIAALEVAVARLSSVLEPEVAVSRIASPIAQLILKEGGHHVYSARFFSLLDVGEALIKYSSALAFAVGMNGPDDVKDQINQTFATPPTLGKLAEGLRTLMASPHGSQWPLSIVKAAFMRPQGKPTSTARFLFEEFINLRNTARGHGAQQPEGYYEALYRRNAGNIHECISQAPHLQLALIKIQDMDTARDKLVYKAVRLMGAAPVQLREPIVSDRRLKKEGTYLWDQEDQFVSLDDFVTAQYCPECGLEHIFFADRIKRGKIGYHSAVGNHRLEREQALR